MFSRLSNILQTHKPGDYGDSGTWKIQAIVSPDNFTWEASNIPVECGSEFYWIVPLQVHGHIEYYCMKIMMFQF